MKRVRTLIVDDAAELRLLLRTALEASGRYEVVGEAGDGVEGIDRTADLRPDLVVLDLSMPRMDGLEALPRLREASPSTTVVVLTGHRAPLVLTAIESSGAAAYIEKGVSPTELVQRLDAAVGQASDADPGTAHPPVEPPPTSTLLSQLTHDLRTQIGNASGHLELLGQMLGAEHESILHVERASAAIDRLHRLLEGAVAYTRAGTDALRPEPIECAPALRNLAVEVLAANAGIDVRIDVTGLPAAVVTADAVAFARVFGNLLVNALRYGGTDVEVHVSRDADDIVIEVLDRGPGFSDTDLEELFTPFERGTAGRRAGGTGLGMAVAARLVQELGGRITASNRPDGGARIWVGLPAA